MKTDNILIDVVYMDFPLPINNRSAKSVAANEAELEAVPGVGVLIRSLGRDRSTTLVPFGSIERIQIGTASRAQPRPVAAGGAPPELAPAAPPPPPPVQPLPAAVLANGRGMPDGTAYDPVTGQFSRVSGRAPLVHVASEPAAAEDAGQPRTIVPRGGEVITLPNGSQMRLVEGAPLPPEVLAAFRQAEERGERVPPAIVPYLHPPAEEPLAEDPATTAEEVATPAPAAPTPYRPPVRRKGGGAS